MPVRKPTGRNLAAIIKRFVNGKNATALRVLKTSHPKAGGGIRRIETLGQKGSTRTQVELIERLGKGGAENVPLLRAAFERSHRLLERVREPAQKKKLRTIQEAVMKALLRIQGPVASQALREISVTMLHDRKILIRLAAQGSDAAQELSAMYEELNAEVNAGSRRAIRISQSKALDAQLEIIRQLGRLSLDKKDNTARIHLRRIYRTAGKARSALARKWLEKMNEDFSKLLRAR